MLNFGASKPRVRGGPGPRGPPLDPHLNICINDETPRLLSIQEKNISMSPHMSITFNYKKYWSLSQTGQTFDWIWVNWKILSVTYVMVAVWWYIGLLLKKIIAIG